MENKIIKDFKELISTKIGLRIKDQDSMKLKQIIAERMKKHNLSSHSEYFSLVEADTETGKRERKELIRFFTVGETYFFRDKGQFELIQNRLLPELIDLRGNERRLRIWSAGCSSGEEPYSLAIIINELLSNRDGWKVTIIGTDISAELLEKAKRGIYSEWSFRHVPEEIIQKYFNKKKGGWEIQEHIKDTVSFFEHDLLQDEFPSYISELHEMDLVLCRNVFIYYDRDGILRIVEKLTDTLKENGYLITGHGELYSIRTEKLEPRILPESVVYRRVKETPYWVSKLFLETRESMDAVKKRVVAAAPAPETPTVTERKPHIKREEAGEGFSKRLSEVENLFKKGDYRKAIEKAGLLLFERPQESIEFQIIYLIAAAHANLGEHEKAIGFLEKATKLDRFAVEPYLLWAHIAEEKRDLGEAKKLLRKVIYLNPSSFLAYLELAWIYEDENVPERASKMRKSALMILKSMPEEARVKTLENMSVGELIAYVEKTID